MATFDVSVNVILRVESQDFDTAAKLAQGILKGTTGRPDSARTLDALVRSVSAN